MRKLSIILLLVMGNLVNASAQSQVSIPVMATGVAYDSVSLHFTPTDLVLNAPFRQPSFTDSSTTQKISFSVYDKSFKKTPVQIDAFIQLGTLIMTNEAIANCFSAFKTPNPAVISTVISQFGYTLDTTRSIKQN